MLIQRIEARMLNRWLTERHYLHRPVIRTKMLGYGIYRNSDLIGGVLWATPHFTKKRGLFGYEGLPDKWEVLVLSRFYLEPDTNLNASEVLVEVIGKSGRGRNGSKRRGWRLQEDRTTLHPPRFPENPFVPRLLVSWSDLALPTVLCAVCGAEHRGQHTGVIYQASGWDLHDVSTSSGQRTGRMKANDGEKRCRVLRLPANPRAERLPLDATLRTRYNPQCERGVPPQAE